MTQLYKAPWFSIEPLKGWSGSEEENCHTFLRDDAAGALQISAYLKDAAVTDKDIQELGLEKHIEIGRAIQPASFSVFTGSQVSYTADTTFWREWYLRNGKTLLFVSNNCDEDQRGAEDKEIEAMLHTLQP